MENLFVWIILLPIIAIYAALIAAYSVKISAPELYADILFSLHIAVRRKKTENFFKNQSKAAQKLYAYRERIGAKVAIAKIGARYGGCVFFIKNKKTAYIFLDDSYLLQNTNGLLETTIAHELGHCLARYEPPIEFCEQKNIICELLREKMAWEAALALFKKLNIVVDEDAFWKRARATFATYIYDFTLKNCDAIPKLNCLRAFEFFPSPLFPLFKEISDEEIKKYLLEIPEENIIKSG